eukprot:TRINITY_DN19749_c0_g1_i1.p1 TRINITY_DN19749_c0_g1~~TRINITY_DN19749_c0_g1_i1.p1  ORF type:complete len:176 (-),score=13.23 TRINITY_DN19749_c0_g1_i1:153-680(-)
MCHEQIRSSNYSCFASHDQLDSGVKDQLGSFPVGYLVGAILCTLVCLSSFGLAIACAPSMEALAEPLLQTVMGVVCVCVICPGIVAGVVAAIGALVGEGEPAPANMIVVNGTIIGKDDKTSLDNGLAWYATLGIIFGVSLGVACLCLCCVVVCGGVIGAVRQVRAEQASNKVTPA